MKYNEVDAELKAGTPPEPICTLACPWDRNRLHPSPLTGGEVNAMLQEAARRDRQLVQARGHGARPSHLIMTAIAIGDQDRTVPVCPVLALRLRSPADGGSRRAQAADAVVGRPRVDQHR